MESALTGCLHTLSRGKPSQYTCVPQRRLLQQARRMLVHRRRTVRIGLRSSGRAHRVTSEQVRAVTSFPRLCDSGTILASSVQGPLLCTYLSRACDTQCCQKPISSMMAWRTQYTLDHRHNTGAVEQFLLVRIFLKHSCKSKSFNRTFPVVACRWLDGDVCWMMSLAIFDREETSFCRT